MQHASSISSLSDVSSPEVSSSSVDVSLDSVVVVSSISTTIVVIFPSSCSPISEEVSIWTGVVTGSKVVVVASVVVVVGDRVVMVVGWVVVVVVVEVVEGFVVGFWLLIDVVIEVDVVEAMVVEGTEVLVVVNFSVVVLGISVVIAEVVSISSVVEGVVVAVGMVDLHLVVEVDSITGTAEVIWT